MKSSVYVFVFLLLPVALTLQQCQESEYLVPAAVYQTDVPEPSGLHFDLATGMLYTVSDRNGDIYILDAFGKTKKRLKCKGEDAEGIVKIGEHLYVLEESSDRIWIYDDEGKKLDKVEVPYDNSPNSGFEGIHFIPEEQVILMANEKHPAVLLKLDTSFNILEEIPIQLADISAVEYAANKKEYWLLSDEEQRIAILDLKYKIKSSMKLPIIKPEGLALDIANDRFYVISDETGELFVFDESSIPSKQGNKK
jgi:uncharacterized protein YjiK